MKYRQHFESHHRGNSPRGSLSRLDGSGTSKDGVYFTEFTSLSDALISLIPIYGPWIIFGIALESAGAPLPGEAILVAAALLSATTGQIKIVIVVLAAAAGAIVGEGMGYMVGRRWTHCGLWPRTEASSICKKKRCQIGEVAAIHC
jgi:membrane protein YqaA with SNARE-associated domain